jgi:antitoxin HicB
LALLTYPARNIPLPKPKAKGGDLVPIAVEAAVAAKLAFLDAFREAGIGKSEFGRRRKTRRKSAVCLTQGTLPS